MATTYRLGCDIGGTFTDITVNDSDGRVYIDKSDTTRPDLTGGVIGALENVADQIGIGVDELLGATTRFVNGTTIVTNSIAELRGARVGLITTKGFRDTLRIARSPRKPVKDFHQQHNVPDLLPRDCIIEVEERVDSRGDVIVPLREEDTIRAVDELAEKGVESIAVSLLWSFLHPEHEETIARIVGERHPDLYLSVSSRIYPLIRDYERTITTVLNSFTGIRVAEYTTAIETALAARGLKVPVSFMQSFGGTLSAEEARRRPIALVDSGPAGGIVGVGRLGKQLGLKHTIAGDMGGTSFDVGVLTDNEYAVTQRVFLREFLTGLTKIDVISVGAGGGSIGWLDARGVPQVGPRSAGSEPGPACYGRGGTEPTTTDAGLVLGIIDPATFLGGRRELSRARAEEAVRTHLADPLDSTIEEAAAAMHRITVAEMSDAVRRETVERGRDPRDFTFVAYGGALGMFAADICSEMGIEEAIIPYASSVFSSYGLLGTDDVRVAARTAGWTGEEDVSTIGEALEQLEAEVVGSLRESGYSEDEVEVEWQGDFKFAGQLFELTVPIRRDGEFGVGHLREVQDRFAELFEAEYGHGTAWQGVPVILLSVRVIATGAAEKLELKPGAIQAPEVLTEVAGSRRVYLPASGEWRDLSIHAATDLDHGDAVTGPAIVEHPLTTIVVPDDWSLGVDEFGNYRLRADSTRATDRRVEQAAQPVGS
ncbi:MAG: hydantoinase/oxoprolinase family protein [Actinobacteria bacterium]|nr:hydantoinase/oxoprolinase family protein [Actinomycetota bacterium]